MNGASNKIKAKLHPYVNEQTKISIEIAIVEDYIKSIKRYLNYLL